MADLLIHEHKKNDAGSYDNVYRKTKAKIVETEDGGTAEQKFATMANHIADKNNPHNVTAAQVGAIPANQKGAAGGVAELDSTGKVPSTQLPSYVDDVLEYGNKSAFPLSGETGKIYIATDTNLSYRWSGSQYVEISPSIALGETSSTAYRGDRGKAAYDHISNTSNPHGVTAEQVGARPNTWTPTASDVGADPAGSSAQALQSAKTYTDQKISAIPTPDVSGQINTHNTSSDAHANMGWITSDDGLPDTPALIDADTLGGIVATDYATKNYVDGLVGNIEASLASI